MPPKTAPQRGRRKTALKADIEAKILEHKDWSFRIKQRGGKPYLYARKYSREKGGKVEHYIGVYNEEVKKILEKHAYRLENNAPN